MSLPPPPKKQKEKKYFISTKEHSCVGIELFFKHSLQ